jgi:hypothetical protein
MDRKTFLSKVRGLAAKMYDAESTALGSTVLSPIDATKAIAEKMNVPQDDVASAVATYYYRENGTRNPLGSPSSSDEYLTKLVRARRDNPVGGAATLSRWETVAASLSAGTGRAYSAKAAQKVDGGISYIGRGTKVAA